MKNNRGAIALFALLSMMFFLIFVMVAYNNSTQKSKLQVESEEVLTRYYQPTRTSTEIVSSTVVTDSDVTSSPSKYLKSGEPEKAAENKTTQYVYSNGKVYRVK